MSAGPVSPLSPERGRLLTSVVQRIGAVPGGRLRVTTRDGQMHVGTYARALYDVLVLSSGRSAGYELPLAEVARVERRHLRLGRALGVGAGVFALGVLAGVAYAMSGTPAVRAPLPLFAFLGGILGAFAAPVVVWLLQDLPALQRWRTEFE